jgi:hypothetical protein
MVVDKKMSPKPRENEVGNTCEISTDCSKPDATCIVNLTEHRPFRILSAVNSGTILFTASALPPFLEWVNQVCAVC